LSSLKRIAITSGEPAGIGPDLCVQLAQLQHVFQLVYIVDPELIEQRAKVLGLEVKLVDWDESIERTQAKGEMFVLPVALQTSVVPGHLETSNSRYVLELLQQGLDGCLKNRFAAVVTAPVHKAVINDAGIPFSGHTEFFADGAGVEKVVMMLATEGLRVALATTHLPLSQVSSQITRDSLQRVINITHQSLKQQFGIAEPRIAICGLNPHAGESGHLGMEEIEVITPVIESLQRQGMTLTGPWPADTIFNQDRLQDYDAVLAMYHDQGLPVLKHYAFGKAVNVTLGLPFIRTSVDHGTALDLAATGKAKVSSLQAALSMAETMINSQIRH
jgi:4-hydroxythreonine-4-phosphate dehydrogenase